MIALLCVPFAGSRAVAQTRSVAGTVVDASGNPVVGAAVVIEGTTKGTSTGLDGSFTLEGVKDDTHLTVSYIGYKTLTPPSLGSQTSLTITLEEDTQMLDDVVVIGYGVQRKSDVTGSITSIKEDALINRSVENIQQAPAGQGGWRIGLLGFGSPELLAVDPYPRLLVEQRRSHRPALHRRRSEGEQHRLPGSVVRRVDGDPQGRRLGRHLRCRSRQRRGAHHHEEGPQGARPAPSTTSPTASPRWRARPT